MSEQTTLDYVEADIKQGTDALAVTADPAAVAYWVPKLSQLASGWVLLQSDYAAARDGYAASAGRAGHDVPQTIAGFRPHGVEAVFGASPVNGAVTLSTAGTAPIPVPVPPPFPPPLDLLPPPVEIAPSPRELSPERAEKFLEDQAFRTIEGKLAEKQQQLRQLETAIWECNKALTEATRDGDKEQQKYLSAKLTDLLITRELARKEYGLLNGFYNTIADTLGHVVPDSIRNFDPQNPGVYL